MAFLVLPWPCNKMLSNGQYTVLELEGVFVQVCSPGRPCTHTAAFSAASVSLLEIRHLPLWLSLPVQVCLDELLAGICVVTVTAVFTAACKDCLQLVSMHNQAKGCPYL
jgi:hypothetical protein